MKEQLAGDLLPASDDATQFEHWTATGFLSLGAKMLAEDDPVKMQMDIVDEQIDTTSRAFMGLTVGCARCHDHKFDPIPTADYYSLAGIFLSSKTMENYNVVAHLARVCAGARGRAPEAEGAPGSHYRRKAKRSARCPTGKTRSLRRKGARRSAGICWLRSMRCATKRSTSVRPHMTGGAPTLQRTSESFERGNVTRKIEKGSANTPEKSKGPYFAEYDVTVPAGGRYQLDVLEQETGSGTADIHDQRRAGKRRTGSGDESRSIARCGRLVRGRRLRVEGREECDPAGAQESLSRTSRPSR